MDKWLSNSRIRKLCNNKVFYFETLDEKVEAIRHERFTHFVDDLLKVLEHKHFPDRTLPILFFPELEKSTNRPNSTIFTISNFASLLDIQGNGLLPTRILASEAEGMEGK
jgi:hypothetical protein